MILCRKVDAHTCKGFRNPLLLPLPWLVILLRGSLVILGQSTLPGTALALRVRVASVLGWLVRRVIQRQLLDRPFLRASTTRPDFYNENETVLVLVEFLQLLRLRWLKMLLLTLSLSAIMMNDSFIENKYSLQFSLDIYLFMEIHLYLSNIKIFGTLLKSSKW